MPEQGEQASTALSETKASSSTVRARELEDIRAATVAGHVALTGGANLFSQPRDGARLGALEPDNAPRTHAWRVIDDGGAFVAIESLSLRELDEQCTSSKEEAFNSPARDAFAAYRLRAHVPRDELMLVTGQEVVIGFDDGSGIVVGAGVPVDMVDGRVYLRARGLGLALPFLVDDLSSSWQEPGLTVKLKGWIGPHEKVALYLDGQRVDPSDLPWPLTEARSWEMIDSDRGVARWRFADHCVQLDLVGPAPPPGGSLGVGVGGIGTMGRKPGPRYRIPANTAASWPDGSDAGESRHGRMVDVSEGQEVDGRVCFPLAGDLAICHAREALSLE